MLNRVLRHNLRTDLGVVAGYAEALSESLDGRAAEQAAAIERTAADLVALGEAARSAEAVPRSRSRSRRSRGRSPTGCGRPTPTPGVTVAAPDGLHAETDPDLLETVVEQLVDNAAAHGGEAPAVRVAARAEAGRLVVTVTDDGPGTPDHEVTPLTAGTETALEHGSGLGLWLVAWGVRALGGDVAFDRPADGGTRVTVSVPDVVLAHGEGADRVGSGAAESAPRGTGS